MTDWRDNYAAVWEARDAYRRSPSASNRVRLDEAMAASKAHLDCSACPPTGLCFCPPKTRNDSKGDTMPQDKNDLSEVAIRKAAALIMNQTKLDETETSIRSLAMARYEQRRQSAIAYCKGDAAAEKAAVARLDASIAHEIELEQYRADRTQQTKLDANADNLSEVTKAQIAYHNRMSTLSSNRGGGHFGGNDAA